MRTALESALFDVERVIVGQDGMLERVAMRRIDLVHGEKPAR